MKTIMRIASICIVATLMLGAAVIFVGCDEPEPNTYSEPTVLSPEKYPDGIDEAITNAIYNFYDPTVKDLSNHNERHEILLVEEQILSEAQKELTVYSLVAYHAYIDLEFDYNETEVLNKTLLYDNDGVNIKKLINHNYNRLHRWKPEAYTSVILKIKVDVLPDNTVGNAKEVYVSPSASEELLEKCTMNEILEKCYSHGYFYTPEYETLKRDEMMEEIANWYVFERVSIAVELMNIHPYGIYYNETFPEEASLIRLYPGSTKIEIVKVTESENTDKYAEFEDRIKREVVCEGTCEYDKGYLIMTSTDGKTYTFKLTSEGNIGLDFIPNRSDEFFFSNTIYNYVYILTQESE